MYTLTSGNDLGCPVIPALLLLVKLHDIFEEKTLMLHVVEKNVRKSEKIEKITEYLRNDTNKGKS